MSKNLLAPPTQEELNAANASAPMPMATPMPAPEEGNAQNIHDLLAGVGQGATLGFGDELLAGAQTGAQALTGKTKLEDMYDTYRKLQQQNQADYGKIQQRSPVLSVAGELAGGLAMPLGALGESTSGMSLGQKLMSGAKTGAKIGAVASAGYSPNTIENLPALAGDIGAGALGGAALGAGTSAAGAAMGAAGNHIKDYVAESPQLKRAGRAYTLEKGGTNLTTESGQNAVLNKANGIVDQITDAITAGPMAAKADLNARLGKQVQQIGETLPPEMLSPLQEFASSNPYIKSLEPDIAAKIEDGTANAQDLFKLKTSLIQNVPNDVDLRGQPSRELMNFANSNLEPAIQHLFPEVSQLRTNIHTTAKPIENIINGTIDKLAQSTKMSDMTREQLRAAVKSGVYQQMKSLSGAGLQSAESRTSFQNAMPDIHNMLNTMADQSIPMTPPVPAMNGQAAKMGTAAQLEPYIQNPNLMQNQIQDTAKDIGALRSTIGMQPNIDSESAASLLGGTNPVGFPQMGLAQAAGKAGRLVNKFSPVTQNAVDLATAPATVVSNQIQRMTTSLKSSSAPSLQKLGLQLEAAMNNKASAPVAATINTIMQSPSARAALGMKLGKGLEDQNGEFTGTPSNVQTPEEYVNQTGKGQSTKYGM